MRRSLFQRLAPFCLLLTACAPTLVPALEPPLASSVAPPPAARLSASQTSPAASQPCAAELLVWEGAAGNEGSEPYRELRDRCGGLGLVQALGWAHKQSKEVEFSVATRLFNHLVDLADPRAADSLVAYSGMQRSIHWRRKAGFALASLGDVRAVPLLAEGLKYSPQSLYADSKVEAERFLARDDSERIVSLRLLADLAELHPERRAWILKETEEYVLAWLTESPQPHANGLRLLAATQSTKGLSLLRDWAFPKSRLPQPGQQPPLPAEWVVAQFALRYLGKQREEASWSGFQKQLQRRRTEARNVDVSTKALMGGGLALLGMSVRALGIGVAEGYAEWGDTRAYPILRAYAADKTENEEARSAACLALAWVTPENKQEEIPKQIAAIAGARSKEDRFLATCLAAGLGRRPTGRASDLLIDLLRSSTNVDVRGEVAEAVGRQGLTDQQITTLSQRLSDRAVLVDSALALLLGGTKEAAAKALGALDKAPQESIVELRERYGQALKFWSREDWSSGRLQRCADNALTAAAVPVAGETQAWVLEVFSRALRNTRLNIDPRALTLLELRYRLFQQASGPEPGQRSAAVQLLRLLGARGALMALRESGPAQAEAAAALLALPRDEPARP